MAAFFIEIATSIALPLLYSTVGFLIVSFGGNPMLILAFVRLLTVLAFVFMAFAGFSVASKLKRVGANGFWSILIGIGSCFGALTWLTSVITNFLYWGVIANSSMQDAILDTPFFRFSFHILVVVAAVFYFIAAINAKKHLAKSTASGVLAAVLFGVYAITNALYNLVVFDILIQVWLENGADFGLFSGVSTLIELLLSLLCLGFAICLTVFFAGVSKHLRRLSGGIQV